MPFGSITFTSDPYRKDKRAEAEGGLFTHLSHASHFLRDFRSRLRYGELSRAPLKLLRFQIAAETVDCDWMARLADPWDTDLSRQVQRRHASLQALRDAVDVRALLFDALPQTEIANVRVFRESADYKREMIVSGCLYNNDNTARGIHSLTMRAKILGFRFRLEDDVLQTLEPGEF
jgi:hypothetical protein